MSRNQNASDSGKKTAARGDRRKFSRRNFIKTTLAGSAVTAATAPALGDGYSLTDQRRAGARHDAELEQMLREYGSEFGNRRRVT